MIELRRLSTAASGFRAALRALSWWESEAAARVEEGVAAVLRDVRERGDAALLDCARRFDGLAADAVSALRYDADALAARHMALPPAERSALEDAARRIRRYHERQLQASVAFEHEDDLGNRLGQRLTALRRVGVYVPGGQASYPSTALMTVIPARVAGVAEVIAACPMPNAGDDRVLAALHVAGADAAFACGGAHAIAALAYGTQTVERVDKIVGPGGAWVAAAKRQVFGAVGIDSIAGPSEILIVADGTVPARWTALDLLSQAEHDAAAQALLLCPQAAWLDAVAAEMEALVPQMPRRAIIEASFKARGALIETRDIDEAVAIANEVAPEHLHLAVADPDALLPAVQHAGAVFLGGHSAEVFGDYNAGPSHVLPTFGTARYASPLGVEDFRKRSSIIRIAPAGAARLAPGAAAIANVEGLQAHAAAALARTDGAPRAAS